MEDESIGGDSRQARMIYRFITFFAVLTCLSGVMGRADAHPHVWVTMTEELLYAPDGSVTGVRHAWTFDDMFSAFATQGSTTKPRIRSRATSWRRSPRSMSSRSRNMPTSPTPR
jgi:hypothetical protein